MVTPYLAQSITSNADFTVWTITMRPGVLFQDGEKCDAAAVAANFNAQRASALTGPVFQTVTGVKVVDDLTVQLTMNQPWSTFENTLTTQPGAMAAPQAMLAKDEARPGRGDGGATHPVGTGPFTFVDLDAQLKLIVKKNPNYLAQGLPLPRRHRVRRPDRRADLRAPPRCRPVRTTPSSRAILTGQIKALATGWPRPASSSSSPTPGC